jgi:hypothetical protein
MPANRLQAMGDGIQLEAITGDGTPQSGEHLKTLDLEDHR